MSAQGTLTRQGGYTLIEMLVSIGIMIVVTGIFGAALFQVFGIPSRTAASRTPAVMFWKKSCAGISSWRCRCP